MGFLPSGGGGGGGVLVYFVFSKTGFSLSFVFISHLLKLLFEILMPLNSNLPYQLSIFGAEILI